LQVLGNIQDLVPWPVGSPISISLFGSNCKQTSNHAPQKTSHIWTAFILLPGHLK